MKTLFIVNPAAGHGQGRRRWRRLAERIPAALDSEAWFTSKPGQASFLAGEALKKNFEAIIAVGGDGTLGEVVDGYLGAPQSLRRHAALGTVPVGSGCDVARHFGIGFDADAVCEAIQCPRIRHIDAGVVDFRGAGGAGQRRHFFNIAAFGLAGEVARRAAARGKPWGGTLSYLLDSLLTMANAKSKFVDLIIDGVPLPSAPYLMVVMANTSTFGGGMRVAPQANPQDGCLDLVTIGEMSRWDLFRRLPLIYSGGHLRMPEVAHRLVRRLEARAPEQTFLNIDGEAVGVLPAIFETIPKAVPFLCAAIEPI